MRRYVLRRLLTMIPLLAVVSVATFVIIQLPPGDYLTTQGQTAREDMRMIEDAGFVLETPDGAEMAGDMFADVPENYPRAALPLVEV